MKAKLLKKIKKRFGWYEREYYPDSYVVVDKTRNTFTLVGKGFSKPPSKPIEIDESEFYFRKLKDFLLKPFGFKNSDIMYRKALRKTKLNNKTPCKKNILEYL